jgi:3-oxoacyl-[acyl-carrier-protein] synthase-3
MPQVPVKILGTGIYLPSILVTSEELEKTYGYAPGTFEKASDVKTRYIAKEETSSQMGYYAVENALKDANMKKEDIDIIVSVSGVPQQALPTNAVLIHEKLKLKDTTLAFDINATCLGFLTGFFSMAHLIQAGVYKNVVLVASDIPSKGLNPKDPKTLSLFGDGAAACILGSSTSQGILGSYFNVKSSMANLCSCKAGGTLMGITKDTLKDAYYFHMEGPKLFKAALKPVTEMIEYLKKQSAKEIDLFIPHQASPLVLDMFQRKLNIPQDKFIHIVRSFGNMIATSLPFALHKAIETKKLVRGQRAILFGTGAGMTIGGLAFEY